MNELDDKVIVDRETLQYLLDWTSCALETTDISTLSAHHYGEGEKHVAAAKHVLTTDLTGWAAVPVEPTDNMDVFATEDWLVQRALEDRASAIWQAMLEASPPLPGGGE